MNTTHQQGSFWSQDRFGRQVAARLTLGAAELPYEISERLRAARARAIVRRKLVTAMGTPSVVSTSGGTATLGFHDEGVGWWNRIASALPLLVLAAGLVAIHVASTVGLNLLTGYAELPQLQRLIEHSTKF